MRLLSARAELTAEWHRFLNAPDDAAFDELPIDVARLAPYRPDRRPPRVARVDVYARVRPDAAGAVPDLALELRAGTERAPPTCWRARR